MAEIRKVTSKTPSDVEDPKVESKKARPGARAEPAGTAPPLTPEELASTRAKFASAKIHGDGIQRRLFELLEKAEGGSAGAAEAAGTAEAAEGVEVAGDLARQFQASVAAKAEDRKAFHGALKEIYGQNYDERKVEALRQRALDGDLGFLPKNVEVRDRAEIDGANGAYSPENGGTISIARDLLGDPKALETVFAEEAGHHLDALLQLPKKEFDRALAGEDVSLSDRKDARGDEGERLAGFLETGKVPAGAVASEVDRGRLADGTAVEFEKKGATAEARPARLPATVTDPRIQAAFESLPEKARQLAVEHPKLKDLASSPARKDRDAALTLLELAGREPKNAGRLLAKSGSSYAALSLFADAKGHYAGARPDEQERIRDFIAKNPDAAFDLKNLLGDPATRELGRALVEKNDAALRKLVDAGVEVTEEIVKGGAAGGTGFSFDIKGNKADATGLEATLETAAKLHDPALKARVLKAAAARYAEVEKSNLTNPEEALGQIRDGVSTVLNSGAPSYSLKHEEIPSDAKAIFAALDRSDPPFFKHFPPGLRGTIAKDQLGAAIEALRASKGDVTGEEARFLGAAVQEYLEQNVGNDPAKAGKAIQKLLESVGDKLPNTPENAATLLGALVGGMERYFRSTKATKEQRDKFVSSAAAVITASVSAIPEVGNVIAAGLTAAFEAWKLVKTEEPDFGPMAEQMFGDIAREWMDHPPKAWGKTQKERSGTAEDAAGYAQSIILSNRGLP